MTRSDKFSIISLVFSVLAIFIGWMSYDALNYIKTKTDVKDALVEKHEQYLKMIAPVQHTHMAPAVATNTIVETKEK